MDYTPTKSVDGISIDPPRVFNLGDLLLKGDGYYTYNQQKYEQALANTSYQRTASDQKAAGINLNALYAGGGSMHPIGVNSPTTGSNSSAELLSFFKGGLTNLLEPLSAQNKTKGNAPLVGQLDYIDSSNNLSLKVPFYV